MPPKSSSGRSPKQGKRKSPRTPASVLNVNSERLGDDDEEEEVESEDEPSVDENPLASVQTLTKIREALSGLSQEELQLLVKGVAVTRLLQIDEKAAATAALDHAVRVYLYDTPADTVFCSLGVCPHYSSLERS